MEITKEQYEKANAKIDEILKSPNWKERESELELVSDIVEAYEMEHISIGKPSLWELTVYRIKLWFQGLLLKPRKGWEEAAREASKDDYSMDEIVKK